MNNNTFPNSIRRYILEGGGEDKVMDIDVDADIDLFEITKFNYRTLFDKSANQNITHTEKVYKFFGIENIRSLSDVDQFLKVKNGTLKTIQMNGRELFIFLCDMPFTEYEFQGKDGKLLNPDSLRAIGSSHGTDNVLIETFSELEFESFNKIIPEGRLAFKLENILKTDIFSSNFNQDEHKRILTKLLGVWFKLDYIPCD